MKTVSYINGINIADYELSYTLTYLIERCVKDYYKLNDVEKIELFNQFDKEISEKLHMPRANFVFKKMEFTLDTNNIYFGDLRNIKSGVEFITRYFFEKRQQYQRICIVTNNQSNFTDKEFEDLKDSYDILPLTKKNNYIPYNKGLEKYLFNYHKLDAILYMFETSLVCLKMISYERLFVDLDRNDIDKIFSSFDRCKKFSDKFIEILENLEDNKKMQERMWDHYNDFKLLMIKESYFITDLVYSIICEQPEYNGSILLCFHENVWSNIDEDMKKSCIDIVNETIAKKMRCSIVKDISYTRGRNSFNFTNGNIFHMGDISKCSARDVLGKLIYEYLFLKVYEDSVRLKDEYMLNEYEKCKNKYNETKNYSDITDSDFIQLVRHNALKFQAMVYDYINHNFKMDGKKVAMPMKKSEFIIDLFKPSIRRR